MQKVYLLLRNNQQTGPYDLQELLQLNLKSFDLVWVEGRSAAWRYPGEIETLKPYVPGVPQPDTSLQPVATASMEEAAAIETPIRKTDLTENSKHIFVSLPQNARVGNKPQPAQEPFQLRTPVSNPSIPSTVPLYPECSSSMDKSAESGKTLHTNYSRKLNDVEDDYTAWIYRQKSKKRSSVSQKNILLFCLLLAIVAGGYLVWSKVYSGKEITAKSTSSLALLNKQQPQGITDTTGVVTDAASLPTMESKGHLIRQGRTSLKTTDRKAERKPALKLSNSRTQEPASPVPSQVQEQVASRPDINQETQPVVVAPESNNTTASSPATREKKKKVRDVLKELFSRKQKEENKTTDNNHIETPRPAANRQAVHRDGSNESLPVANLENQLDISSNAPDNWMMGVSGLKVTLHNRSSIPVQSAAVAVLYFDENNQLLEKKTINFNNLPAKGKLTMAAPDQKWADHVDFKLSAITAGDDRFARE